MWPLIIENEQQLDKKEKNAKLCNTYFFLNKVYFQRHKSH